MLTSRVFCAVLLPILAAAQDFSSLEKTLQEEIDGSNTPGAAIAVVQNGSIRYAKGVGLANLETRDAMPTGMVFRLGSTTKMFTAATLVTLAEQGKLDLNTPVGKYLPELTPCLTKVTAHQLLTHTAGIKDDAPMFGSHDDAALAANVRSWKEDYCAQPPGGSFRYSNPGYVLAGYLAEVLSGRPFADAVNERILQPVGMTHSSFRPTMAMTFPIAVGHNIEMRVIRPAADYAGAWPAGSLFSSVYDLARWTSAFLGAGRLDGDQALSTGVITKLSTPYVDRGSGKQYGYGLEIWTESGIKIWQHEGNRDGYGTVIRMLPDQHAAIIILGNRTGAVFPKTLAAATAMLKQG